MIEVSELCKYYGNHKAIDNISFHIEKGQIVGLLGLNGAGKSTILKILATFLAPTSGTIKMAKESYLDRIEAVRAMIGYLPDSPPLYKEMKVYDYLTFVAKLKGVSSSQLKKNLDRAISQTNLQSVTKVTLGHLSHGFCQRVGIAQAIIHDPKVLILDEPINGLDPLQIVDMRDLILSLKGHYTVILSSHILSEITKTCDKVLIIDKGKLVAEGYEADLQKKSQSQMTLKVGFRGDLARAKACFSHLEGITKTAIEDGQDGYKATLKTNGDLRGQIARALCEASMDLTHLSREDEGLESLFMKLLAKKGD